jgi:ATP-dependent DNA helicase RecQ
MNHSRVSKYLENQNQLKKDQLKSVMKHEDKVCKSKLILGYFGEKQLLIAVYFLLYH